MTGVIVHEWIAAAGGSEKVLQAFADLYPEADIRCLWNDATGRFPGRSVHETWLARTPLRRSKALALPLMPLTWARAPKKDYEWALTSSHLFAHHANISNGNESAKKFSYVHTPARYLWNAELDSRGANPLVRFVAPAFRAIDKKAAKSTHEFAANSNYIRDRIRRTWDRDARVIHPPVDIAKIQSVPDWSSRVRPEELRILENLPQQFVLGASRFVPYKRLDLVIEAGAVSSLPVVIAGSGPGLPGLRELARNKGIHVTFVERPSDELLYALYQRAMVFVFPAVEDFGIMPVEAMACGTPVIVNSRGGAGESVNAPIAGIALDDFSGRRLSDALHQAAGIRRETVAMNSRNFSLERFRTEISSWVDQGVKQ